MQDFHEIKTENYRDSRQDLPVHYLSDVFLIRANRFLFCVVILLLAIIFSFAYALVPPNKQLIQFTNGQILAESSSVLAKDIAVLKNQMAGLISGSIETKLRNLELSIKADALSAADLNIITGLRSDINILRSFSKLKQARLFTSEQENIKEINVAKQLIREATQLKMLLYITLASCSLMLTGVVGVWLKNRYLLGYEKKFVCNTSGNK